MRIALKSESASLVSAFCLAATSANTIDVVMGFPGLLRLPVTVEWVKP